MIPIKTKHLLNQLHLQPKIHIKIHCQTGILRTLRHLLNKYKVLPQNCNRNFPKVLFLEKTEEKTTFETALSHKNRCWKSVFTKLRTRTQYQLLQQLNQPDTAHRDNETILGKTQKKNSTPRRVPTQQIARTEFSIPTSINFQVMADRQKDNFAVAISFTQSLVNTSRGNSPFENHCKDKYSIPLIREKHDS